MKSAQTDHVRSVTGNAPGNGHSHGYAPSGDWPAPPKTLPPNRKARRRAAALKRKSR